MKARFFFKIYTLLNVRHRAEILPEHFYNL